MLIVLFVVLAFDELLVLGSHFWSFTDVQPEIRREVTRKSGGQRNLAKQKVAARCSLTADLRNAAACQKLWFTDY
jgi:hypothetical protein